MKLSFTSLVLAGLLIGKVHSAPETQTASDDIGRNWAAMHESKKNALEEFNDAKFGMFIHWGLYSQIGGVWKGQDFVSIGCWIMKRAEIPRSEYAAVAKHFNPRKFNAGNIALLAKSAGMKYVVFTAKHHDGFAMFRSDVSDFNVVEATPFKRDVTRELYEAAVHQGLRVGLYYSHALDWMDGGDGNSKGSKNRANNFHDPSPVSFENYLENKAKPQVQELLTTYPNLISFWFDAPLYLDRERSYEFYELVNRLQPKTLSADRIGNNLGDYLVPGDNKIPQLSDVAAHDRPWEGIVTTNNTWEFKYRDSDWKSTTELLYWMFQMVSLGGNFLLNIGPTWDGEIAPEVVARLHEVGQWMLANGEAIYGTTRWCVAREGPTAPNHRGTHQRRVQGFDATFTPQDIWYTTKPARYTQWVLSCQKKAVFSSRLLEKSAPPTLSQ